MFVQITRINLNLNRRFNSFIIWFIQYPLLGISFFFAVLVIFYNKSKKELIYIIPTLLFLLFIFYKVFNVFL